MVHRCHSQLRPADSSPAEAQPFESLRGRDFVDQMKVYIEQGWTARALLHDVGIPDLLEQRSRHQRGSGSGARVPAGCRRGASLRPRAASSDAPACRFPSSDQGIIARSSAPTRSIG
jgi:hypothetical protein